MKRWSVDPLWTGEDAIEQERQWLAAGKPDGRVRGPYEAWESIVMLTEYEKLYLSGEKGALIDALSRCALDDLVMPDWLARAFLSARRKVVNFQEKSWDSVFGRPHKKGVHLAAERKRIKFAPEIWTRMVDLLKRNPETPVDAELYASAASDLGVEKTLAQEYVAWFSKRIGMTPIEACQKYRK